jgi:hypothetical protein
MFISLVVLFRHIRDQDAYVARNVGSPLQMAGAAMVQASDVFVSIVMVSIVFHLM